MTDTKQQQVAASEMVERVARALFGAENIWRDMQQGLHGDQLPERHFKVAISEFRMKAREVIAAMRDPGPDAMAAIHKHLKDLNESDETRMLYVGVWWECHRAMIDAALSGSSVGHLGAALAGKKDFAEVCDVANSERLPGSNLEPTR